MENSKYILTILLIIFRMMAAQAQDRVLVPDLDGERLANYFRYSEYTGEKSVRREERIDLKPYCPVVGDQDATGACAAFATVYGALSITHAVKNGITRRKYKDKFLFSPSFMYNTLSTEQNKECNQPLDVLDCLELLKSTGALMVSDFPITSNCQLRPNDGDLEKANNFKIKNAAVLFDYNRSSEEKVAIIRNFLNDSIPVIAVLQVWESFTKLKSGSIWWEKQRRNDHYMGGNHVITVVGYDDSTASFEILNSWGRDWGNNGYIKIPYETFTDVATSAFVLDVADEQLGKNIDLSELQIGSMLEDRYIDKIVIRSKNKRFISNHLRLYIAENDNGNLLKRGLRSKLNDKEKFFISENKIRKGEAIQIEASNIDVGNYFYLFSIDSTGKSTLHWPRKRDAADPKIIGANPFSLNYVMIPESDKFMLKAYDGDEWIVALTSSYALDVSDIEQDHLSVPSKIDLDEYLLEITDKNLIPSSEIRFERSKFMTSSYLQTNKKSVLPMIIKL